MPVMAFGIPKYFLKERKYPDIITFSNIINREKTSYIPASIST